MRNRFLVVTITCLIFLIASMFANQSFTESNDSADVKFLTTVVREGGWTVPKIDPDTQFGSNYMRTEHATVLIKEYRLFTERPDLEIELYEMDPENRLRINRLDLETKSVRFYTVRDTTFAFRVIASPILELSSGKRAVVGAFYEFFYFDEDGDGQFETRSQNADVRTQIPDWVLE